MMSQSNDVSKKRHRASFIHGNPVPPSHFIGRTREIAQILSQLANPARGCSAISGDPRVGKTSLLHYLFRMPQVREEWGLSPTSCHFLYLDCHTIVPFSETAFWHHTLRQLEQHLSDHEALDRRIQRLSEQDSPDIYDLNSLFDRIARVGRLVVLMLDEFEWIVEEIILIPVGISLFQENFDKRYRLIYYRRGSGIISWRFHL